MSVTPVARPLIGKLTSVSPWGMLTNNAVEPATVPTWAGDDCDAPVNRWQSREAVRQMAASQGWQIQRLKIDDGCYEIRGTDAQGQAFKAKIDPETLKVLKMKRDKHRRVRDGERDREAEGAVRQNQPQPPDGGACYGPLPGLAGQIGGPCPSIGQPGQPRQRGMARPLPGLPGLPVRPGFQPEQLQASPVAETA